MRTLYDEWLIDKAVAFSASILAGADLDAPGSGLAGRLERATHVTATNVVDETITFLADSTLALLDNIPTVYKRGDPELLPNAEPLANVISAVNSEIEFRTTKAKRLPEILIAHAVYLLKHSHLSMRDLLKWLRRHKEPETREIGLLLKNLDSSDESWAAVEWLLDFSRDASQQTRDRIDAVDRLYSALMPFASPGDSMRWWLRICLTLRSAFYCWPLMVSGSETRGVHGISLPIGLFLSQDGESKVYFRIVNPAGTAEHRRYVPRKGEVWAHMEGSNLQWNGEWARAFQVGLEVAKTLWRTQNGRLRFVDEATADAVLNASLVVDLGAACAIVDQIFDGQVGSPYRLTGRSAEAYWVQAVLGMLLPGRELPLGVVTGRVETVDGAYEIHHVQGISKKLEYANNAGFSRVILPSGESDDSDGDMNSAASINGLEARDPGAVANAGHPEPPSLNEPADPFPSTFPMDDDSDGISEDRSAEAEVQAFLRALAESNTLKRVEINFCRNVRNVADAMQMSGWRRTAFIRLCAMQRVFSMQLRRLFVSEQLQAGTRLTVGDRRFYQGNAWTIRETRRMQQIDRYLLSDTRAIKFVDRARFDNAFPGGAEVEIGRWLAWKDHQVRSGSDGGTRAPGLGVLCLRSTETDNEIRLWSTIADTLSASPEWWNAFQWSSVAQAAQLLSRLLGNRRADPSISSTPAPDLIVLFDEGDLTRRRTNPVFPDDFRGQWVDLLNASMDNPKAPHHLDEALRKDGYGSLGPTRIIVVHGCPSPARAALPDTLVADERDALERLAVFRFDFTIQAAYAVLNYDRPSRQRLAWIDVEERVGALVTKRAVFTTRGRFYIAPQLLSTLRDGQPYSDPEAHLTAAKALAPILEPRNLFIASNRDRTLEPENVLEATWHLHRARSLVPPRNRKIRVQCEVALSTLTFLRPFPDWDTVKQLQHSTVTLEDAVELGRELLSKERSITGRPAHSSRVAALLHAIGDFGGSLNGPRAELICLQLTEEATELFTDALKTLETLSESDARRQKRKLFSEYVYCMKMLGASDENTQVFGALRYLAGTVAEVVDPDFYDDRELDDYPVTRDWLRAQWSDRELPIKERSTYAYVASRLHIGRWREGVQVREPWDQPWIEYFSLTTTEDFYASQLHSPLVTWDEVYGRDRESAERFGLRVRNLVSYLSSKDNQELSWWGSKIRAAADNLWDFINHSDSAKRLRSREADIALHLISVSVMYEAIPAFDFVERRGAEWFGRWPARLGRSWSRDWNNLAALVVSSQAGWVSMLSSLSSFDEPAIELVRAWIHAYRYTGATSLNQADPEKLVDSKGKAALVDMYRRKRAAALWNGYQLLAQSNERGWVIYGDLRVALENVLRDIDGTTNSWFFAIATREPDQFTVAGAYLMLQQRISDASLEILSHAGLEGLKAQFRRSLAGWLRLAKGSERPMFEKLRRLLSTWSLSKATTPEVKSSPRTRNCATAQNS